MRPDGFASVLRAAQRGDDWAFERLYRDLAPAVAGYLRVQSARDPDGLTGDVFLGVFRGIAGYVGDEQGFRSWVFTIAHRRLIDDRRRSGRAPLLAPLSEAAGVSGGNVEADVLEQLASDRVRALCARLRGDQRDVLLLRLVAGMTVDEVAILLGKSVGATKALQRRGLAALRVELDRQGVPL
jgi:RNA polymerase sigma-70 factor (ECF subfamily)